MKDLTPDQLELALRNSGYDFNSKIIDAEFVGCIDDGDHDRTETAIYEVSWDPAMNDGVDLVAVCNTLYISYDSQTDLYYADI